MKYLNKEIKEKIARNKSSKKTDWNRLLGIKNGAIREAAKPINNIESELTIHDVSDPVKDKENEHTLNVVSDKDWKVGLEKIHKSDNYFRKLCRQNIEVLGPEKSSDIFKKMISNNAHNIQDEKRLYKLNHAAFVEYDRGLQTCVVPYTVLNALTKGTFESWPEIWPLSIELRRQELIENGVNNSKCNSPTAKNIKVATQIILNQTKSQNWNEQIETEKVLELFPNEEDLIKSIIASDIKFISMCYSLMKKIELYSQVRK